MKNKLKKRNKKESLIIASAWGVAWTITTIVIYSVFLNEVGVGVITGLSGGVLGFTIWYLLDRFIQKRI